MGHRLEAHHPEWRDVLVELLHTSNLLLCVGKNYKRRRNWSGLIFIHTYESDNKDAEEDPEGVADDVHEDDGGEGDGEAHLSQPLATLSPAEDVPCSPEDKVC